MPRYRITPLTTTSVRQLASRRGYLLAREDRQRRLFKLFDLSGQRAAPIPSKDPKRRYTWRLADADAWLRKQPLLRDLLSCRDHLDLFPSQSRDRHRRIDTSNSFTFLKKTCALTFR